MLQEIMSYIIIFWIGFSFLFPPFAILFFVFILLLPQIINNLKHLFIYIFIIGILLYFWNHEMHNAYIKHTDKQLDDFADLSLAISQIFTFFLNLSLVIGTIVRFVQLSVQLYKRYKRIKFIKKHRKSRIS
ncbi:membrane hypothetical protein [Hyella patelloides LEGE 07179]|uniref:Uncharacterized protein n=1 Tax=Hyella patelloides LEGE 07179 TaxID=945734 RepID=A0A563VZ42_9CYAN|nr:hypothetical protein [Hyella patelloides]VEP16701.1 membrane hypothetical protein [Hyella patelloides LEGE 07179]